MVESILKEDLQQIVNSNIIDWELIKGHSFLITGSTGLIGSILVRSLLLKDPTIKLVLPVRNTNKAKALFGDSRSIEYLETNIESFTYSNNIDYIIHAASPTKSKYFINNPVETLDTSILGTKRILDYCTRYNVKSVVYLSSMEMYGTLDSKCVNEDSLGYIDPLSVRSSYSEGKRICELYCKSYYSEMSLPVKIARLAMTFGAGISKNENRVYKYFCDCLIQENDIVLKSNGETYLNYCYTTDAILGILSILLNGVNGEAYNVCSDFCGFTIKDLANYCMRKYGKGQVKFDLSDNTVGFAPITKMIIINKKLKNLGWSPSVDIKAAFDRLFFYVKDELYNEQ